MVWWVASGCEVKIHNTESNNNISLCLGHLIVNPYYLKSIDVEYGNRQCVISWVNQLVDMVCQPVEQKGVQDLGNGISGVFKVGK